ncbi:zinc finger protein 84-like [Uloborus diversus]|uniref:zinc finger protein 84-like n=1 Tax=Uloborus diversus TaxID=327109 RepID=UPI00240A94C1|nr:zinc finger protein 84-like [Uloborus diversus]
MCDYLAAEKHHISDHVGSHMGITRYCASPLQPVKDLSNSISIEEWNELRDLIRTYDCEICGRSFKRKDYLTKHLRVHTGEKPFGCNLCDYKCSEKANLNRHMKSHSSKRLQIFTIYFDFKGDSRPCFTMQRHSMSFTPNPPEINCSVEDVFKMFSCSVCGRNFTRKDYLRLHMRTHTGEKPYQCSVCNYRCSQRANLVKHQRIHSGQRPYKCGFCNYSAAQLNHVNSHMLTHL